VSKPYKVRELLFINDQHEVSGLRPIKKRGQFDKLYIGKFEGRCCYVERHGSKMKYYRLQTPPSRWKEAKAWTNPAAKEACKMSIEEMYKTLMRSQGDTVTPPKPKKRKEKVDARKSNLGMSKGKPKVGGSEDNPVAKE